MTNFTQYEDLGIDEVFPQGKLYRVSFCSTNMKLRIVCSNQRDFDYLVDLFSDTNPACFFMKQYGYNVPQKISMINQFGYFAPGLLFGILKSIKMRYGSLSVVAISEECKRYIQEWLYPLKAKIKEIGEFEISNISEDSGRNEELRREGKNPYLMRDYQEESVRKLIFNGFGKGMIQLPTACHEKGHPILMYNGEIKKVEDIKVGDFVMGPDSKPRKVLRLHNGIDEMYKINANDNSSFVVNQNHILSLVRTKEKKRYTNQANKIENVSVKEYLTKSKWWKHVRKLYHVGVDFETADNKYKIPPYILGLILGDGSLVNCVSFTSMDKEILEIFENYCISNCCQIRKYNNGSKADTYYCRGGTDEEGLNRGVNHVRKNISELGLMNHNSGNKFIPFEYKTGRRNDRLEILAGLIDTDGCTDKNNGIDYMSKSKQLAEDFDFIARSLGFKSYIRTKWCTCQTGHGGLYYRVTIHGDIWTIPLRCKRKIESINVHNRRTNVLRTGFKIKYVGRGEYFGFELDGDHLYLDGKFMVHHNSGKSNFIANYFYNLHKNINQDYNMLLLVPNKQLVFQMYNDFKDYGMDMSKVTKFTAGLKKNEAYNPKAKIIIANRQYVFINKKLLPERIDVLFCDEIHSCCSESTAEFINTLDCRLKAGCSGSIPKDKINKWKLIGMFGDVIHSEDITDLQKRGFISNLKLIRINVTDMNVQNNRDYLFHLNPRRKYSPDENGYSEIPFNAAHEAEHEYYEQYYKDLYKPVLEKIGEYDENTLFLFDRIEFGKRLLEMAEELYKDKNVFYIDGSIPVKERLEITRKIEESGNNVLFAEKMTFSTGINLRRLTNLVFISSSKSFPFLLQAVGRTLRLHSTKKESRIIDCNFNFKYSRKHLKERLEIYKSFYNKVPDEQIDITIN